MLLYLKVKTRIFFKKTGLLFIYNFIANLIDRADYLFFFYLAKIRIWYLKRNKLFPPIVSVTGSLGKSSVKEAMNLVMGSRYKCWQSNFNNQYGMPYNILNITRRTSVFSKLKHSIKTLIYDKKEYDFSILELAISDKDDMKNHIDFLGEIDTGIFTCVDKCHTSTVGDLEDIAREKSILLNNSKKKILNLNDFYVLNSIKNIDDDTYYVTDKNLNELESEENNVFQKFPHINKDNIFYIEDIMTTIEDLSFKIRFRYQSGKVRINNLENEQYLGEVYAKSLTFSIACGVINNIDIDTCCQAVKSYTTPHNRNKLLETDKNNLVYDDSYNSSIQSTVDTINNYHNLLCQTDKEGIIFVSDVMNMLDDFAYDHIKIYEALSQFDKDIDIYLVGSQMKDYVIPKLEEDGFTNLHYFKGMLSLIDLIKDNDFKNKAILLKGFSRYRLFRLIKFF